MPDIYDVDFRKADLNLLVVFAALMQERSTTRAAARLHLSQGAVSAALGRLRRLFGDELFVRSGHGMTPTARAGDLARTIGPALVALRGAIVDRGSFDPTSSRRTFVLGMSDDIEAHLMPRLAAALVTTGACGSGPRVSVRQTNRATVDAMLDGGKIDLGLVAAPAHDPEHRQTPLFTSGYTCLYDPGLLPLPTPLTLDAYLAHPHVLISYDGRRGIVDDLLEAQGLSRRLLTSTTHFAGAVPLLKAVPSLATMPRHAAATFARTAGLRAVPPPLVMPDYTVSMVWHATSAADPALIWLREAVRGAAGVGES
ncbi:LysR substrate-binding domain-containing protein [Streptomyces sp. NPDC001732]